MPEPQRIIVEKRGGCGSSCLAVFAVVAVVALAYEYWYVTLPVLALGVLAYWVAQHHGGVDDQRPSARDAGLPDLAEPGEGWWEADPLDPQRERWRNRGGAWTDLVQRRD